MVIKSVAVIIFYSLIITPFLVTPIILWIKDVRFSSGLKTFLLLCAVVLMLNAGMYLSEVESKDCSVEILNHTVEEGVNGTRTFNYNRFCSVVNTSEEVYIIETTNKTLSYISYSLVFLTIVFFFKDVVLLAGSFMANRKNSDRGDEE